MENKIIFDTKKSIVQQEQRIKPIILLDIDDTIAAFGPSYWNLHNTVFDDNVDYLDVNDWNLDKFSKRGSDAYKLFKYPGLFRNLPPMPYAKEFVEKLRKVGEVVVVSDSPSGTSYKETVNLDCIGKEHKIEFPHSNPADDKREWLKEHFNFKKEDIIFTSRKELVMGHILIDDKPTTYEKFKELNRNIILMDAPYNRHIQTKWRAKDLNQAIEKVYEMLEEMGELAS
jgi:5'(3')-deoxyribonucleotidase